MYVYNAAWLSLALVLTGLGVGATVLLVRSRGFRGLVLGAAWTLLPMALYLTGTLRVLGVVLDVVAGYLTGFAFSPVVWLGVILAGLSALLFGVSKALKPRRRGAGVSNSLDRPRSRASTSLDRRPSPAVDDDMADIEAILRRRGIS